MKPTASRRRLLQLAASALGAGAVAKTSAKNREAPFKVSLAQWSLNKQMLGRGKAPSLDPLEFCRVAKGLGIGAVEYVNQMFFEKAEDKAYLGEMLKRQQGEGVEGLLIMCDREGNLGDPDDAKRSKAVENHLKWLDAAATLGCHSIRVNAASDPKLSAEEQRKLAADGLHQLCLKAESRKLYVVVENHGGLSSNGLWLTSVMQAADHPLVGILPDFGNFYTDRNKGELYNPYKGLREFMPWVKKGMSAKAYDWDTGAGRFYTEDRREGREISLDFERLIGIVVKSGYRGHIGIEYEGEKHEELDGIRRTKQVLDTLAEQYA